MPAGTFAHFRLVGSGLDDPNIEAEITSVSYELSLSSIKQGTIYNKFDLYFFAGNDDDYNCFVMGAQLWSNYGIKYPCDFITMRPSLIKSGIYEYSGSSATFLNAKNIDSEFFAVIDNSGYYTAITN